MSRVTLMKVKLNHSELENWAVSGFVLTVEKRRNWLTTLR